MRIPASFRLAFWVLASWGVFALLAKYTSFPALHWFPLAILGTGIFLFKERPLVLAGFPAPFETSLVAICGLLFLSYASWTILGPMLEAERLAQLPCAPKSLEAQCYSFSRDNCAAVWSHFENDCKMEVKKKMEGSSSTKLTGPIVRKCTYKKMDQSFRSNRKIPVEAICREHFSSLDALSLE